MWHSDGELDTGTLTLPTYTGSGAVTVPGILIAATGNVSSYAEPGSAAVGVTDKGAGSGTTDKGAGHGST
jgi:hypothetical protein